MVCVYLPCLASLIDSEGLPISSLYWISIRNTDSKSLGSRTEKFQSYLGSKDNGRFARHDGGYMSSLLEEQWAMENGVMD